MEIIILGAGKPSRGTEPSALKKIGLKTVALDWQIDSFNKIKEKKKIIFMGGYQINKIKNHYSNIYFKKINKWNVKTILDTFLQLTFKEENTLITYSDTIFKKEVYLDILNKKGDAVFVIDSQWKRRYSSRSKNDITIAETINLNDFFDDYSEEVEFTGLILLRDKSIKLVKKNKRKIKGKTLIDLLTYLKKNNLKLNFVDIQNRWAEFNSEKDVARFLLGTKSETLRRLRPILKKSTIGKQHSFTVNEWKKDKYKTLKNIQNNFKKNHVIVRSSSIREDGWNSSAAGAFTSVLNVNNSHAPSLKIAITKVIDSYGKKLQKNDQIFVQKQIKNVFFSGVVFTCDLETGLPYYKINLDHSNSTDSITSGSAKNNKSIVIKKNYFRESIKKYNYLKNLILAVKEIEKTVNYHKLDIEFAVDNKNNVHIFQVRPITIDHSFFEKFTENELIKKLNQSVKNFRKLKLKRNKVIGNKAVFGNMPDWNPAEIIGVKPNPLSMDLYKYLITNSVWSIQRKQYGYRHIKKTPLMVDFCNQPYIDVRASLNSFIPNKLPEKLSQKLCNSYLDILEKNPNLHDKIEFNIAFTAWTPNFIFAAKERLKKYQFSISELIQIEDSLKEITKKSFLRIDDDIKDIKKMHLKRAHLIKSKNSDLKKFIILIGDCRKYGTLPFAHSARAGFVAVTLLKSFVKEKIFSTKRYNELMSGVYSVSKQFDNELNLLKNKNKRISQSIKEFGHLRPGTYEILNKAYWEDVDFYFKPKILSKEKKKIKKLIPNRIESKKIKKVLENLGSDISINELMSFFYKAIEYREFIKFEFTKNLSLALDLLVKFGIKKNIERGDLSFLKVNDLKKYNKKIINLTLIKTNIKKRQQDFCLTNLINLPSIITDEKEFFIFEQNTSIPNFITLFSITANLFEIKNDNNLNNFNSLKNKIIMIERADPGFDWLFGHEILGIVTKYGGANSHMAIRSAEKNLPAAIGVGIKIFDELKNAKRIKMDCKNKTIERIN